MNNMKKIYSLAVMAVALLLSFGVSAQTKWKVDRGHSNVKFSVQHMVVSELEGSFRMFDGTMEHNKADFSDAKINFTVDVASVNTDNDRRDGHLKSDDFFNADQFPKMTFVSTSVKPLGGNKFKIAGNLTIRDVTKPVVFDVTHGGVLKTQNGSKAGFKARTTIDRFVYNLKWSRTVEAGGLAVGKDVEIVVNVEMDSVQ